MTIAKSPRKDTEGTLCLIYKGDIKDTGHFSLDCPQFEENFHSIWRNLHLKIIRLNPTDGVKIILLVGGLSPPFDHETSNLSSAVGKIYKLRTGKLHEVEAPWLTN